MKRLVLIPLLMAFACGDTEPDDELPDGPVTYYEHVKPLMDAKCASCHYDGGIAPFSLTTYEQASANAGISQIAVNDRIMPPWLAADDCHDYFADRSLSDTQIELFNRWVDGGAMMGDPADEPPPMDVEQMELTRVDLTLDMGLEYTATQTPDDYRCFVIEWPEAYDTTQYVTGFRVNPGNLEVAHHAIAYLASPDQRQAYFDLDASEEGPGYTCFGGPRGPSQTWLASWAPGTQGRDFPAGTGTPVEPGSLIILQMHYNSLDGQPAPDRTTVDFRIDSEVDKVARSQPWANPGWLSGQMEIPAGDPDVMHSWSFDASIVNDGRPFDMHGIGFHMHTLGTSGRVQIDRADNSIECLVDIPRWDFDWQNNYAFREPVRFNPGDRLYMECHWDNSATNQPMVDGQPLPPQDVNWGDGTTDEMCLTGWLMTDAE